MALRHAHGRVSTFSLNLACALLLTAATASCKTLDIGGIDDVPSAAMATGRHPVDAETENAPTPGAGGAVVAKPESDADARAAAARELQFAYSVLSAQRSGATANAAPLVARGMYPKAGELYTEAKAAYDKGDYGRSRELAGAAGDAGRAIEHTLKAGNAKIVGHSRASAHAVKASPLLAQTLSSARQRLNDGASGEDDRAKMYRQAGLVLLKDAEKAQDHQDYTRSLELAQAASALSLVPARLSRAAAVSDQSLPPPPALTH